MASAEPPFALSSGCRARWIDTVVRISARAGFAQTPGRHHAWRVDQRADWRTACCQTWTGAVVAFDPAIDISTDQKFIQRDCRALAPAIWNALSADCFGARRPCCRCRSAAALTHPTKGSIGQQCSFQWPSNGSDGLARYFRAAPRAQGTKRWPDLRRGQSVAAQCAIMSIWCVQLWPIATYTAGAADARDYRRRPHR